MKCESPKTDRSSKRVNMIGILFSLIERKLEEKVAKMEKDSRKGGEWHAKSIDTTLFSDSEKAELKRRIIEELVKAYKEYRNEELVRALLDEVKNAAVKSGYDVIVADFKLTTPGLWGASSGLLQAVLDVGLEWDYLVDVPVVRGSTVKGAVRSVMLSFCARKKDSERRDCVKAVLKLVGVIEGLRLDVLEEIGVVAGLGSDAKKAKSFVGDALKEIVEELTGVKSVDAGIGGSVGLLVFFDAYPVGIDCSVRGVPCSLLEPMVLTPHYYSGGRPVEDEYDARPVPVPHVVVGRGTVFRFLVAYPASRRTIVEELLQQILGVKGLRAWEYLLALLEYTLGTGVMGARSARSYNVFRLEGYKVHLQRNFK